MLVSNVLSHIDVDYELIGDIEDSDITSIEIDSRRVQEGSIFVALKGEKFDGHDFIDDVVKKGAKLVVVNSDYDCSGLGNYVKTNDVFGVLIDLLKGFYSSLPDNIYAVTGTNGKTSIVEFTRQILGLLGKKSASIGTLGVVSDVALSNKISDSALTTADIVSLYKNLAALKSEDINDVAIEVSSIGLEQNRIAGLDFAVASFSNFSVDHLDYHKTREEYFRCKMLLFDEFLGSNKVAILNSDISELGDISDLCIKKNHRIITYGYKARDLKIISINAQDSYQEVKVEIFGNIYDFTLHVSGEFQVYNVLCALGNILTKYDLTSDEISNLLGKFSQLKSATGRMDLAVKLSNKARVFIDFAHTPDALENVLTLARKVAKNRVCVLIGCGGNRDKSKRPIMGEVASRLADVVIVSDDNPRTEDASQIRKEIISGIKGSNFREISPRNLAIKDSIAMLEENDILILAGKGHEKYQIIGDKKHDFDEVQIVKDAVFKLS
ncbi:MAG: UDP-N-acetylmuramoyl-L-alanyl-D-glutamate--2,6-diaminopimelate ligase [Rickettsiales bacterium]|nr:UDP-N-acetylmuramoyl-L-alanyl-D-glutamate--2,6-diaminopimelate ligase [Rickettsiales bacterium]